MFLPINVLIAVVFGAYLVGLITIPVIALIILRNPSRMHANTRATPSRYANKRQTRQRRRY